MSEQVTDETLDAQGDGPVVVPFNEPPQGGVKRSQAHSVPAPVIELLQAEIEIRNKAMARWHRKLAAAATLSGVPEGSRFQFKQNVDGTFVFLIDE